MSKVYLYGKNPLIEGVTAYKKSKRPFFENIFLTKDNVEDSKVMSAIQSAKLSYSVVTRNEIESMVGKESIHQGICASLVEKFLYTDFDEVLENLKIKDRALIVLLDELQDPHNVGAIIRSAKAFNADAILIPEYNQTQLNGTVIKSATGTNFLIPIVKIGNINTTLKKLKDNNFWIYGLTGSGDTEISNTKFDSSTVIVIGGEGAGIKQKTLENCDFKLSININPECESLNASVAAAVTLYEFNRQNKS